MIGIGILSFNRPDYLRRLLASLEAQTDLSGAAFHLYQDGAVNAYSGNTYAKGAQIDACAKAFDAARLPRKAAHVRDENAGIGIASFEAIERLTAHYDRVMLLEDDVVLSPDWVRLAKTLYADLESRPDVFSVSPGFRRGADDLGRVIYSWHHMWCECFTAQAWRRIRPHYLPFYEQFVAGQDYYQRPEAPMRAWQAAHGGRPVTSQDGGRETAIKLAGMVRARCAVNRALGIGQRGLHFTPSLYAAEGFGRAVPFIHPSDATREAFEWD